MEHLKTHKNSPWEIPNSYFFQASLIVWNPAVGTIVMAQVTLKANTKNQENILWILYNIIVFWNAKSVLELPVTRGFIGTSSKELDTELNWDDLEPKLVTTISLWTSYSNTALNLKHCINIQIIYEFTFSLKIRWIRKLISLQFYGQFILIYRLTASAQIDVYKMTKWHWFIILIVLLSAVGGFSRSCATWNFVCEFFAWKWSSTHRYICNNKCYE